jgi:transposase InsO family protein
MDGHVGPESAVTIKRNERSRWSGIRRRGDSLSFVSGPLIAWANKNRITMLYIQPGKPTQNAYIERFNRTARHEWLDMHLFYSVAHA